MIGAISRKQRRSGKRNNGYQGYCIAVALLLTQAQH